MGTLVNCVSLGCHAYFAAALADVRDLRKELREIREDCCSEAVQQAGIGNNNTIGVDWNSLIRDELNRGKVDNDNLR